ncbi:polysaccharide pyruvyl transferase family protein [Clostridium pasteurianum]|uniref:Exopolysaccharide biosynthesis protein n=1 Tax=Clostridium pasteurianum BC1 TaxID=86416 RepID=R4K5S0_CLOPA|nr:polysaccharide pyruvyl transferase family protein [Clostridium pasteurianum]AGK95889.1 exopolysaccharide biosynthesis protein [Clostridium pasteurianum BC1]
MRLKEKVKKIIIIIFSIKKINKYKEYKHQKKIIYLLSPLHGNMGDQAIAYATLKFYQEQFSDYKIIEFDRDSIYSEYFAIKNCLNKDDIIVLHGGGNMGNLYMQEEKPRRFIINNFRDNKIISMTQTISFTNDEFGKKEKEKTQQIYNKNKKLILLAREDTSYNEMIKLFTVNVIKVPDIVFYLADTMDSDKNRTLITTCLRSDKESIWKNKKDKFKDRLQSEYNDVFIYDTVINRQVTFKSRIPELNTMWDNFKKSKVVVTDRLHGMIFCVITKTPCIALKSLDHKVVESYKWIKDLDYVELVDDLDYDKLKPIIERFKLKQVNEELGFKYKYYDKLAKTLKNYI